MIENIRILADYREKRSGIPELLQSKVNVKIVNLVAGDYLIDEQVIVERKTNEDFIQLIGPSLALRLLISFGSIEYIMHASSKELAGIRGIGKAKAKGIKGFISCRYK